MFAFTLVVDIRLVHFWIAERTCQNSVGAHSRDN